MHGRRFKDFILRLVIASAHSYFVPAWGEGMPTNKEVPVVPAHADSPSRDAALSYRDIRASSGSTDHWRNLLLKGERPHRVERRSGAPAPAATSMPNRYM